MSAFYPCILHQTCHTRVESLIHRLHTDTAFALNTAPDAAATAKAGPTEAARDNTLTNTETRHGKATNCSGETGNAAPRQDKQRRQGRPLPFPGRVQGRNVTPVKAGD
jgi:hypothetical protein